MSDLLTTVHVRPRGALAFVVIIVHAGTHHPNFALDGRIILSVSLITHDRCCYLCCQWS